MYVKSPLRYMGNKYKILDQIIPLFPRDIDVFYDLFGGGGDVTVNVKANKTIYNDLFTPVKNVLETFYFNDYETLIEAIDFIINAWGLGKQKNSNYLKLRKDFNNGLFEEPLNWVALYVLTMYGFNYQYRFNKKGEFNSSPGLGWFNPQLRKWFKEFHQKLTNKDIEFLSVPYYEVDINLGKGNNFVYCDPPYLITRSTYNKMWDDKAERKLLEYLDRLNDSGVKFALSNVLHHKGKTNHILKEWSKKYHVSHLQRSYTNNNYQTKNRDPSSTDEVLITNYNTRLVRG